ncbi:MAG: hypothetical protein KatS3mg002_0442 [Candidatus Woesearchaeota archaeon]|nr:MAG: hypothetical protein KatS3mg002_0442 [Candidatus Woesearchaeota archaeon]
MSEENKDNLNDEMIPDVNVNVNVPLKLILAYIKNYNGDALKVKESLAKDITNNIMENLNEVISVLIEEYEKYKNSLTN